MNGRTATVKYIALEEHFSIPKLAEQWPFAWAPARSCSAKLCRGRGTQAPGVHRVPAGGHGRDGHRRPGAVAHCPWRAGRPRRGDRAGPCPIGERLPGPGGGRASGRPTDAARQRDALLQVPFCLLEPGGPDLGAAEADQRLGAPGVRHPRRPPLRQVPIPLRRIRRSVHQLIRRGHRRELGIGRADTGREPGEQLMGNGGLPVQVQAGPVIGKQPGRPAPRPTTRPATDDRTPAANGELAATAFVMRRCDA
jgi:hypothetical protein